MPFRSEKQERYMFAKHPKIAKRWVRKYGSLLHALAKVRGRRKKPNK